jgi:alkylated DNA repair protein alkB family protein 8
VNELPANSFVADVGCGNGKYLGLNPRISMIGSDISERLVAICRRRGYEVLSADCLALPYTDERFDYAINIAVLHHISTVPRRIQVFKELLRIVKPGGRILLTAWAKEQEGDSRRVFNSGDVFVPWHIPKATLQAQGFTIPDNGAPTTTSPQPPTTSTTTPSTTSAAAATPSSPAVLSSSNSNDDIIDHGPAPTADQLTFQRYCHVYERGELDALVTAHINNARIIDSFYDKGNWCIVLEKLAKM